MKWKIVLDTHGEKCVYAEGLSREEALQIIEEQFESGNLTRQVYKKLSLNTWCYRPDMFLHLMRDYNVSI